MAKIEIDLNDLGFHYDLDGDPVGNRTLADAVVEQVASRLLASDFGKTVRSEITDTVNRLAHDRAQALVEEAFTMPIQRTTRWGEAQGEPTTVREIVREAIEQWIALPPNRDSMSRASNGVYRGMQDLMNDTVKSILTKELQAEIVAVKKKVADQIRDTALQAAAAALSPVVR